MSNEFSIQTVKKKIFLFFFSIFGILFFLTLEDSEKRRVSWLLGCEVGVSCVALRV